MNRETGITRHVDGSWGFWNETWTEFCSGYASEADAARAQRGYAEGELDNRDTEDARWYKAHPGRWAEYRQPGESRTRRPTSPGAEQWLGVRTPVLDHGYVELLDYAGNDAEIVMSARTTTDTAGRDWSDDRALLRYMMRHRHTTPFEMCEIRLLIQAPIFVARQWVRHRTANTNEYSMRYSDAPDFVYRPLPDLVRRQSTANRQGSGEPIVGDELLAVQTILDGAGEEALRAYRRLRDDHDLARERARCVLPVSSYTRWVWKIDLHNLLHFLSLRLDAHAQEEIRAYARAVAQIVEAWVPEAWAAFRDYRLGAATFSRLELVALATLVRLGPDTRPLAERARAAGLEATLAGRELAEFVDKLVRMDDAPAPDQLDR